MKFSGLAKGAATAVALSLLSACSGADTVYDPTTGASGCSNLSPVANAVNQTDGRVDVRCGPQTQPL